MRFLETSANFLEEHHRKFSVALLSLTLPATIRIPILWNRKGHKVDNFYFGQELSTRQFFR